MKSKLTKNSKIIMKFRGDKKPRPKSQIISAMGQPEKKGRRKSMFVEMLDNRKAQNEEKTKVLEKLLKLQEELDKAKEKAKKYYDNGVKLTADMAALVKTNRVAVAKELQEELEGLLHDINAYSVELCGSYDGMYGNPKFSSSLPKSRSMIANYLLMLEDKGFDDDNDAIEKFDGSIEGIPKTLNNMRTTYIKMAQAKEKIEKIINEKFGSSEEEEPNVKKIKEMSQKISRYYDQLNSIFKKQNRNWEMCIASLNKHSKINPENIHYGLGLKRLAGKAGSAVKRVVMGASKKKDPSAELLEKTAQKLTKRFEKYEKIYTSAMKSFDVRNITKLARVLAVKPENYKNDFFDAWSDVNTAFTSKSAISLKPLEDFSFRLTGFGGSKKFKNSKEALKEATNISRKLEEVGEKLKKNMKIIIPVLKA